MQRARTSLRQRRQFGCFTISKRQLPIALTLQAVMGEFDLREVNAFALATKLQQRDQPPIKHEPLLDGVVAVVENLRQKAVHALERAYVGLEQYQRIDLAGGLIGGFDVLL